MILTFRTQAPAERSLFDPPPVCRSKFALKRPAPAGHCFGHVTHQEINISSSTGPTSLSSPVITSTEVEVFMKEESFRVAEVTLLIEADFGTNNLSKKAST